MHDIGRGRVRDDECIGYDDAKRDRSMRRVTIRRVMADHEGRIYLRGFCHMRQAVRTCRVDRVRSFADPDGDVIPARDFLGQQLGVELWARSS